MKKVTKKGFNDWNNEMFVKYNNERMYFHPNPFIRFMENKRVRILINMLDIKPADKVLELGCGEGYILDKLPKSKITGVDLSDEAIKRAKIKLKKKKDINLIKKDATKTGLEKNTYDKIYASEVIEHVLDPKELVEEMVRLAHKNSILVITFPNENLIDRIKNIIYRIGLYDLLLPNVPRKMDEEWHLHTFGLDLFKKTVKRRLKIVELRASPFMFLPVRYIAKCRLK